MNNIDSGNNQRGNAFEGESYVGKSVAIEEAVEVERLRGRGVIAIPEYAVIGQLPKFKREDASDLKRVVERIIDLEKRRTNFLIDETKDNSDALVLWDRSVFSCLAFEIAAKKAGFLDATMMLAEAFQKQIADRNVIVPSGVILLKASPEVINFRRKVDLAKGKGDVIDFLKSSTVIATLNESFDTIGEVIPKHLFLMLTVDSLNPRQTATTALEFIAGQPKSIEREPLDIIAYAQKLLNVR